MNTILAASHKKKKKPRIGNGIVEEVYAEESGSIVRKCTGID